VSAVCDHAQVSRHATVVAAVASVSGLVLVVAGVITATGWGSGAWSELVLVVAAVIFVGAVGVITVTVVITSLFNAAAVFLIPQQPPGLERISSVIEQWQGQRDAEAARRAYERQQLEDARRRKGGEAFIAAVSTTRVKYARVPSET
jgi:hypothetical protein